MTILTPGTEAWAKHYFGDPGAPGSAQAIEFGRRNIVPINFEGTIFRVHRLAKPMFEHLFFHVIKKHAPKFGDHLGDVHDDWSFLVRYISGTTVLSMHAFALAVDLNATENPRGAPPQAAHIPEVVYRHWENIGGRWGGHFSTTPDNMHFENAFNTPAEINHKFIQGGKLR